MIKPSTIRKPTAHAAWDKLKARVIEHKLEVLCRRVLEDADFCEAPGSAGVHHCRESGLLEHTAEVVELALASACSLRACMGVIADPKVLVVAGVYHDLLKTRDYFWEVKPDGRIAVGHKPYHKRIHHISGSCAEFMRQSAALSPGDLELVNAKHKRHWEDSVGHALLAHHGRVEWHSPVEPQTTEAMIIHQADYLSAAADHETTTSERWSTTPHASNN